MCKPDNGSGIAEYFRKAFSNKLLGKINTDDVVKNMVKKTVTAQLKTISNEGVYESDIHVEHDPNDPTKINVNVRMNIPAQMSKNLVVMDSKKEQTHSWKESYNKGVYKCTNCGMTKVKMNSKEVNDDFVNDDFVDDYIAVADYNCTCDEMLIKDIIE